MHSRIRATTEEARLLSGASIGLSAVSRAEQTPPPGGFGVREHSVHVTVLQAGNFIDGARALCIFMP